MLIQLFNSARERQHQGSIYQDSADRECHFGQSSPTPIARSTKMLTIL